MRCGFCGSVRAVKPGHAMVASKTVTIRLDADVSEKLSRLARETGRSRSRLAAQAVAVFVDRELRTIEGIWRTLNDDVIDGATFDHLEHFSNELFEYLVYYNAFRPHQALDGLTPKAFALTKTHPNRSTNL